MENEKILTTIKKLFELSKNNPSEEEAKSAAFKAQELLAKYHIDAAEVEDVDLDKIEAIDEIKVDIPAKKWKYTLAEIVAKNFRCKHFYYGRSAVVFYGHHTDAWAAAETFKYLFRLGDKLACKKVRLAYTKTRSSDGVYNSFVLGFCAGVREVFEAQSAALMIVTPQDVIDRYADRTKNAATSRVSRCKASDYEIYQKGKESGRDAVKKRALEA